jgi:hypothetical protein
MVIPFLILGGIVIAFLVIRRTPGIDAEGSVVIAVKAGGIQVTRGRLKPLTREMIHEILSQSGVSEGAIAIASNKHITFSRHIPEPLHQRLRNVLLNQ